MVRHSLKKVVLAGLLAAATLGGATQASASRADNDEDEVVVDDAAGCSNSGFAGMGNINVCGNALAVAGFAASSGTGSCSNSGSAGIGNVNVCGNALAVAGVASSGPDADGQDDDDDDNNDSYSDEEEPGAECSNWGRSGIGNINVCGNALAIAGAAAATP